MKKLLFAFCVLLVLLIAAVSVDAVAEFRNNLAMVFGGSSEAYPPPYPPPYPPAAELPQIAVTCTGEILPMHKTATPQPVEPPTREPTNEPPPARSTATDDGRSGRDYPTPRWTPFETPVEVTP